MSGTIASTSGPHPEPHTRLGRIAAAALDAAHAHPEAAGSEEVIVLIRHDTGTGYDIGIGSDVDDPAEMLDFLLTAIRGQAAAAGVPLQVIAAGRGC